MRVLWFKLKQHIHHLINKRKVEKEFQDNLVEYCKTDAEVTYKLYQRTMITEYLENAYTGARMMDDPELVTKIARALAAFNADLSEDIFTQEFQEQYIMKETQSLVE